MTFARADAAVLTVEFKMNLLAAADGERIEAVGEVIRTGRTLTVCRLDAYVKLIAVAGRPGVKD